MVVILAVVVVVPDGRCDGGVVVVVGGGACVCVRVHMIYISCARTANYSSNASYHALSPCCGTLSFISLNLHFCFAIIGNNLLLQFIGFCLIRFLLMNIFYFSFFSINLFVFLFYFYFIFILIFHLSCASLRELTRLN